MNHLMEGLPKVTGHSSGSVVHRPFFVFWFMGQISRALTLWSLDNSLLIALDVGKAIVIPIEYLMSLFPCDGAFSGCFRDSLGTNLVAKPNVLLTNVSASNWWLLALALRYPRHLPRRLPLGLLLPPLARWSTWSTTGYRTAKAEITVYRTRHE